MDLTSAIVPKSDQINADDLISGPRTFTIENVTKGSSEQPFNIHLVENPGRAYRPSKSMWRVLVMAWGKDSDDWPTGGRVTLYRDPEVKFGRDEVGGIKISHLSHIDRAMTFALTEKRGSRKPHTVKPLPKTSQGESPSSTTTGAATPGARKVEGADAPTSSTPPPADPLKEVGRLMKLADITEAAHASAYVTDVVGHEVTSTKELTPDEVQTLIESLKREVGER